MKILIAVVCLIGIVHAQSESKVTISDTNKFVLSIEYDKAQHDTLQSTHQVSDFIQGYTHGLHLSHIGSARQAQIFQSDRYTSSQFQSGLNQFTYLKFKNSETNFYNSNQPFTQIQVTQGRSFLNSSTSLQDNIHLGLFFTRMLEPRIQLLLKYHRVSDLGLYFHQKSDITSLTSGIQYKSRTNAYNMQFLFSSNAIVNEENGGIQIDSIIFDPAFRLRSAIPTNLSNAIVGDKNFEFSLNQYYVIPFSILPNTKHAINYSINWNKNRYYYEDVFSEQDSFDYKTYFVDSNKIDFLLKHRGLHHELEYTPIQSKDSSVLDYKLSFYTNWRPTKVSFDSISYNLNANDFGIRFSLGKKNLELFVDGFMGNQYNSNCYGLEIKANYHFPNLGLDLTGGLNESKLKPEWIIQNLQINKTPIWNIDIPNQQSRSLYFKVTHKNLWLPKLEIKFMEISNFSYFDGLFFPKTLTTTMRNMHVHINYNIFYRLIGLNNDIYITQTSPDPQEIQTFYSVHTLYAQFKLFKKTQTRIGVQTQIEDKSHSFNYNPVLGYYYPSTKSTLTNTFPLHFFLGAQVNNLYLGIHMDNISRLWNDNQLSIVNHYPLEDWLFKIKLRWDLYY